MKNKRRFLYMKTDPDNNELPVFVADSPKELAVVLGVSRKAVDSALYRQRKGMKSSYHKIEI